jgi:SAM-dependent methyltransferase
VSVGIELREVEGAYDSNELVVARIYKHLQEADIVVSVVREVNANVFFESGYALGWGKPILYVARDDERIPFDIAGVERFIYRELDPVTGRMLGAAMRRCAEATPPLLSLPAFLRARQHLVNTSFSRGLFGSCVRYALSNAADWISSWGQSQLEFTGSEAVTQIGAFILDNLADGGFATQYYPGQESWQHDRDATLIDYFAATRHVVARGRKITRVYVLDSADQIDDQALRGRIWADVAAGVTVAYVTVRDLPDPRARDFGLWDDALLGEVEYLDQTNQPPKLHRCRYFADAFHLQRAREWESSILRRAQPCPDLPSEGVLLRASAFETSPTATAHCRSNALGKPDCSSYHVPWQHLRLCRVVSEPSWHGAFYAREFREWSCCERVADTPRPRVLITGLADYAMLYWVAQSLPNDVRQRCEFHVLDICNTPLDGCRWLQGRLEQCSPPLEIDVHLHHEDIFATGLPPGSFDLITSDAFLTRFATIEEKRRVIAQWSRLLRPGGRIVTTARVRHREIDIQEADRRAFVARAEQRAAAAGLEVTAFLNEALGYAEYIESAPFNDEAELNEFVAGCTATLIGRASFSVLREREMVPAKYARLSLLRAQ